MRFDNTFPIVGIFESSFLLASFRFFLPSTAESAKEQMLHSSSSVCVSSASFSSSSKDPTQFSDRVPNATILIPSATKARPTRVAAPTVLFSFLRKSSTFAFASLVTVLLLGPASVAERLKATSPSDGSKPAVSIRVAQTLGVPSAAGHRVACVEGPPPSQGSAGAGPSSAMAVPSPPSGSPS